jgi:DNA invertase Pin-like site-specific DNA recombinase
MMFFGVMAAMAGYERDLIARRTSDAMQQMKRQGLRVGAVPFGWNLGADGRTLEKNEQEQEIVREIRSLREGGCSFAEIARTLNARSLTTKNGSRWTHVQAQRVLSLTYGAAA